jgi:hypothetical protein
MSDTIQRGSAYFLDGGFERKRIALDNSTPRSFMIGAN